MARSKSTKKQKEVKVEKSNVVDLWAEENPAEFHVESEKCGEQDKKEPEKCADEKPITAEDLVKAAKKLEEAQENFKKFTVHTNGNFIKMKAYRTAIPMYQLPEDLRKYLLRKGFGTNVWEKDQEWLDKHNADPEMIEKLKQFISKNYL